MIPDAAVSYFDKRCLCQVLGGSINCRGSMGQESEETTIGWKWKLSVFYDLLFQEDALLARPLMQEFIWDALWFNAGIILIA